MAKRAKQYRWVGVHVVLAAALVAAAPALQSEGGATAAAPTTNGPAGGAGAVVPGEPAPPFVLEMDSGQRLTSADLRGKVVVLNLWASWCPPCLEELPSLERLRRQLDGSNVVVIGVSVDKDWADVRKVVEKTGAKVTMALDPEQKVARSFGTSKFPETYILDRNGVVVRKLIGEQIWDRGDFVTYLQALGR